MLIIADAAGLARALDPAIRALLELRRGQLLADGLDIGEIVKWLIVEPVDTLAAIETVVGFALAPDPPWEWVLDHSGIHEAPIITDDTGFGIVLIVPDSEGIDPALLALLRRDANASS